MKIQPAVKKARKRTEAVKKIIERKFSKKEIDSINLDHRLALIESAELPRRFMEYTVANTECLAQMQMEIDNVIVNCHTLGDKSYELRTKYLPDLEGDISASFNEQNKAIERLEWAVISFGIATITMAIYLAIGYFYG